MIGEIYQWQQKVDETVVSFELRKQVGERRRMELQLRLAIVRGGVQGSGSGSALGPEWRPDGDQAKQMG